MKRLEVAVLLFAFFITLQLFPVETTEETGPSWYRDAVVYEAFARSFYDTDGNGIGDIKGLIAKLDYLNDGNPATDSDLEVTAIWLMPIFASPSYHGYDVTDYYQINKDYGTMEDFETLLKEAHKRGIKIILDLVLNHTSNKHPDFLSAGKGPESPKRDWYVWKKEMPQDWGQPWSPHSRSNSVWHQAGDSYYYGIFYFGMPDLNYDNPEVKKEMKKIMKFWLGKGVDGFRLDAIRYLTEEGPKLGQQDVESTHAVMAEFYNEAKKVKKDCILIGEIWADMDTVASYFKSVISPAQVDSGFNFDLAGAIVDGVKNNSFARINVTQEVTLETYPEGAIDSIFLTNHDMDRIASVIGPDTGKLKLAASVLLTLPGVPYVYYGEEIGMMGKKPDEHIRRPMKWDKSQFAGFTNAPRPWIKPDMSNPGWNAADMQKDKDSLLGTYKKMIRLRNRNIALRRGSYKSVNSGHAQVYAFLRSHPEQNLLVVHNFSAATIESLTLPETIKPVKELLSNTPVTGTLLAPYETKVFLLKGE